MSSVIQDPTVGAALEDLFNLKGRVRPSLEDFIIPTVQVADLSLGARPPLIRHASAIFNLAAVAGERPVARFEAIPGTICVIRKLSVFTSAGASNFSVRFVGNAATLAALGTVATKAFTDGRLLAGSPSGAQTPSGVLTMGTQVASLGTMHWQSRVSATNGLVYEPPGGWVVGTGHPSLFGFLEMQAAINNSTFEGGIEWDEYYVL